MRPPTSYLLCGTPRTGSTLLCGLLTSTGVAGYPESYFREPNLGDWARRLGVPVAVDDTFDFRDFAAAVRQAGSTPNGVFGGRVMWGTMDLIVDGLEPDGRDRRDVDVLTDLFGPLRFVYLRRVDVVGQAVSWARAEQTGRWQQDERATTGPRFDRRQIADLIDAVRVHNDAWASWFERQGIEPIPVTYEDLVADRRGTVERLLDALELSPPQGWRPDSPHTKQADEVNAEWVERFCTSDPDSLCWWV